MSNTWVRIKPDMMNHRFSIPKSYTQSQKHHIYGQRGLITREVRLICIDLDDLEFGYLKLRFWSLDDELLSSRYNILEEKFGGSIYFSKIELKDFIDLLKTYKDQFPSQAKNEAAMEAFKLINPEDYEQYLFKGTHIESHGVPVYEVYESGLSDTHYRLFSVYSGRRISIQVVSLPKSAQQHEFYHYWRNPSGGLNLSKDGIDELIRILSSKIK